MAKASSSKNNPSSATIFFIFSTLLVLVSVILLIGSVFKDQELRFGGCTLKTEIAKTASQKARGLSGRQSIASDYAMIFPFQHEKPPFWMKDMLVPIDIVWVAGDTVVKVDASVPADDGAVHYLPPVEIDWVVETAAGRAAACGVESGTKLHGLTS